MSDAKPKLALTGMTSRKLKNRGLRPMRYHMRVKHETSWIEEVRHGAIVKVGRTKVLIWLVGLGFKKVDKDELRHMQELAA